MRIAKKQSGFTLIEVLVVIGIIGLLMSITVVGVRIARNRAKIAKAQHDIDSIYHAITDMMIDTNEWPGHQTPESVNNGSGNEVWDLSTTAAGVTQTDGLYINWGGPYMITIGADPWGNNYFMDTDYQINSDYEPCDGGGSCSDAVVIGSFGPNGEGPNQYDDDDIIKVLR